MAGGGSSMRKHADALSGGAQGCDNTARLGAWEQTLGFTHLDDMQGGPTMAKLGARKSGSFKIGGGINVNRLGFGAMRITGPGIWGPPTDKAEALRTLKRVPALGIDFIHT